jgi:hypothetical protein
VYAVIPASTEQQKEVQEKSIKMSWIKTAVERRSARGEVGWEARFPRFFKAKGIAD